MDKYSNQINITYGKARKSIAEKLAFTIIILFSLIGLILSSIIIHEYSHYFDYRGLVNEDQLCGLSLPKITENSFSLNSAIGYYSFSYNQEDEKEIKEIGKTTETKAYFLNFLIFLAFDICLAVVIINRIRGTK